FFVGKGNCARCHMVNGRGGVLGPDLSNIGHDRSPAQIEHALLEPGPPPAPTPRRGQRGGGTSAYRSVTVRLRDGGTLRGVAKNESAFDLQLLDLDGKLHLFQKNQLAEVVREKSLMPKVEGSATEVRDLVAYLNRLSIDPNAKSRLAAATGVGEGIAFSDVAHPKPGTWPTYHGNESGNRFSPLNQINTGNVEHLAPKWMFTI